MRGPAEDERTLIDAIVRMAGDFHRRGWMWGTSGNLSVKLSSAPLIVAITASGGNKGELTSKDIVLVPVEAEGERSWSIGGDARPSAESAIHLAVYRQVPSAGAVLHVHTVASTLLSLSALAEDQPVEYVDVTGLEMLKGWGVSWQDERLSARIPVLRNKERMDELAADVSCLLADGPAVPLLLVAGHGMTVWGDTPDQARNRLEIAEFICQVLWEKREQ